MKTNKNEKNTASHIKADGTPLEGVNSYGQSLLTHNEFGQSLEAEVWHFDALANPTNTSELDGRLQGARVQR